MPFVPAAGIISLNGIMTLAGQRVENTFHYHVTATINRALLQAMATTYVTWWASNAGLYSDTTALVLVYLRDLTTQSGQTLDFVPAATTDGTRANPALSNNCTLAIKRETGLAGRQNRGRVYWVGLTTNMLSDSNTLIHGTAATLAGALNTLMAAQLSGNAATEVIYHRSLGTGTPVVGYVETDDVLDSQRRRLPGHNIHH